jgi:hypothetical protein
VLWNPKSVGEGVSSDGGSGVELGLALLELRKVTHHNRSVCVCSFGCVYHGKGETASSSYHQDRALFNWPKQAKDRHRSLFKGSCNAEPSLAGSLLWITLKVTQPNTTDITPTDFAMN